jgi:HAD superfamily hydrolase (TIGR01549 family)
LNLYKTNISNKALLEDSEFIFWDFDGVIKDSINVKSVAFFKIFEKFGTDIALRVKKHHEDNCGLSRFEKIPIYLDWAGKHPNEKLINEYCIKFSKLVKKNVIQSDWVPGVLDFISSKRNTSFFLITATPQDEIEEIMFELDLMPFFDEIVGAPTKKYDAMKMIINKYSLSPNKTIMIGDSDEDFKAAKLNLIPFVLRKNKYNINLQKELNCPQILNFNN